LETEAADDFVLTLPTILTGASFNGLLPVSTPIQAIGHVVVEIYRVFPNDSDVSRTSGPPTFSTTKVPTRVNSPSDVEFADRDSANGDLSSSGTLINPSFTAANSVNHGINPFPNQTTGGEGPVTGEEVAINATFTNPLTLPAGHYFIVPQVDAAAPGPFYWLSAPNPQFSGDLQTWIRNPTIDPDWLRVATDIVGHPPNFNGSFTLNGTSNVTTVTGNVSGNFSPPPGSTIDIENATVTGTVKIKGADFVRICNSTINGSITVSGSTGFVLIGDGGDEGGFCPGNHVHGTVRLTHNHSGAELGGTSTGGNVFLTANNGGTGEDLAPEVEANNIHGSLKCSGNSPAPTNDSRPNTVVGAHTGQCAGFA
jgi:hypothetical protein